MLLKGTISLDDCDSSEVVHVLRHVITAAITFQFVLRFPLPFSSKWLAKRAQQQTNPSNRPPSQKERANTLPAGQ